MKKTPKWKTKGQTLIWLKSKLKYSIVPNLIVFNYKNWSENSEKILEQIERLYNKKKIAIRSSSIDEDNLISSNAGAFESYLNIKSNNRKLVFKTINSVFSSYKMTRSKKDEVIIQEMVVDISMSGVIFTHEIKNIAPYYSINYDDISGSSDTVTSGDSIYSNKTLYIHRNFLKSVRSKRFSKLMLSITEIEKVFKSNALDIEFAVTNKLKVMILQVRPIVKHKYLKKNDLKYLNKKVSHLKQKLTKDFFSNPDINSNSIFGQMPDWNPAEMIGVVPRNLSFSLYKTLITDQIWCLAREDMGYARSKDRSLMYNFCGHPFINVKTSFFSFLPKKLNKKISKKLVLYWLEKLKNSPELHDKVEFNIAITTFSFDIEDKLRELPKELFSKKEKNSILEAFYEHFCQLMKPESKGSIKTSNNSLSMIESEFSKIKNLKQVSMQTLLELCRVYGTMPFAKLARHAFIGTTLMKSLNSKGIISAIRLSEFFSSVKTILSDMLFDIQSLKDNNIKLSDFKKKYGHLRPGTYDITSKCYRQVNPLELFGDRKIDLDKKQFKLKKSELNKINKLILHYKLPFKNGHEIIDYIKVAIEARESSKFKFTAIVDAIFTKVKEISKNLSITTDNLSYLNIEDLALAENRKNIAYTRKLKKEIEKNKYEHKVYTSIKLPQLIMDENHAVVVPFQVSAPNFITNKIIEAPKKIIESFEQGSNLNGKIVLIESADPGYDWLFTTKFKGLITKYGGANSHMAIRCAELEIPAAIGCGEQLFESLKVSRKIYLNCSSSIIRTT